MSIPVKPVVGALPEGRVWCVLLQSIKLERVCEVVRIRKVKGVVVEMMGD